MRLFGAMLFVFATYFCGRRRSAEEGKPLLVIESMYEMITYIRRRIKGERASLFSLFASYEDKLLEEVGFLPIMRSGRSKPKELWKNAVEMLELSKELKHELLIFGNELGELAYDEQLKRFDMLAEALEKEKQKLREILPAKQKTTRTIWLLGGILTVIVLL